MILLASFATAVTSSKSGTHVDWTAIGTIVALLALVASFCLSIRGQKQDREIAENTAKRSEAAAALSESYTSRVVDALEKIASGGSPDGADLVPEHVKWSLRHHGGDTYILENVGGAKALGVTVSGHETLLGPNRVTGGPDLGPGEALTFMAGVVLGTQDTTITVDWTDEAGTPSEWRYPLPARPPRPLPDRSRRR
jgi:hypothetical protein